MDAFEILPLAWLCEKQLMKNWRQASEFFYGRYSIPVFVQYVNMSLLFANQQLEMWRR